MYQLIPLLSLLSGFIPLLGVLYAFRTLNAGMRTLAVYFLVSIFVGLIQSYLGYKGVNNLWTAHIFTIIEYGFLALVYSYWQPNQIFRKILQMSIPVFTLFGLANMYFFENLSQINSNSISVEGVILGGTAAYTLFIVNKESVGSLLKEPRFWIGAGTLLYFAGTLMLFGLSSVLVNLPRETARLAFLIQAIMSIIANFLYAGGFLCQYQAQKSGGR